MPKRRKDMRDIGKIAILLLLLSTVFISTGVVMSVYQQHLLIDDKTVIERKIGFGSNNTVNIKGNMVQYQTGDIVPIEGRDYIQITGRQVQVGETTLSEGIRTLTASLTQNVLFEQKIGEIGINQAAQIGVDNEIIGITPTTPNIIAVKTADSQYNVEFTEGTTYIKSGRVMLRLTRDNSSIKIYLVGVESYTNIWIKVV